MPPCLTLSIIRYGSRVKWSNPGKGVAPSPTPWCSKLSKREPSGHPRLWSPTLLYFYSSPHYVHWILSMVLWTSLATIFLRQLIIVLVMSKYVNIRRIRRRFKHNTIRDMFENLSRTNIDTWVLDIFPKWRHSVLVYI